MQGDICDIIFFDKTFGNLKSLVGACVVAHDDFKGEVATLGGDTLEALNDIRGVFVGDDADGYFRRR